MKKILYALLPVLLIFLIGQKSFSEWKKEQNKKYQNYISKQDKDFAEFLKKNWKEYKAFKENKLFEKPKIKKPPVFTKPKPKNKLINKKKKISSVKSKTRDIVKTVRKEKIPKKMPQKIEKTNKIKPIQKKSDIVRIALPKPPALSPISHDTELFAPDNNKLKFSFWGFPVSITKANIKVDNAKNIDKNYISKFWYKASITNFKDIISDLQNFKRKIKLNDWGYCLLVHDYTKKIFPNNKDNQNLFDWFLLIKSGYNVKVGFNSDRVILLMPSKETIYGYPYINQDGKNFYLVDFDNKKTANISVYTYDGKYPNANDILDFSMNENPNLKRIIIKKELKFKYNDTLYTIPVEFDKNISEFLKKYPITDLSIYFNSELGPIARYSIVKAFRPILSGKTQEEAVSILLKFMQTAFKYKTDEEQFGYEKIFFPEETLFYPYNDCEDRAILFSYLVRTLIGLDVIGLDYPGHVATAVNFDKNLKGDIVKYGNKTYLICDPTYINAPIGKAMPKFKTTQPKIITIASLTR